MPPPDQIEISRWLDASWCPDPYSSRQMGYPCDLVRAGGSLVVIVRKRRQGKGVRVAELPPFVCNMHDLELYHRAGAYVDVVIEGSDRQRGRVKISLYISGAEVVKHAETVRALKSEQRDARKNLREREAQVIERKRRRRRRALGLVTGSFVLGSRALCRATASGSRAAIRGSRQGWRALLDWTNRESSD